MDGVALSSPGLIGCGGVFSMNKGFYKGGFSYPMDIAFSFEVELLALIQAINYATCRDWNNLWLESDSSYVICLLTNRSMDFPWSLKVAWTHCLN